MQALPAKAGPADSIPTLAIDTLLPQLHSPSAADRAQSAVALARPGPRSEERIRALADALGDTNQHAAATAAWALAQFGREAVPGLLKAAADRRPAVRTRAIYAFGEIGPAAMIARSRVLAALGDDSRSVREMASWSLRRIDSGPGGGRGAALGTLPDLTAGLASPDPFVRMSAVLRHQAFASGDVRTSIPLLIKTLSDPDPGVRGAAADVLVLLGPPARPLLMAALSDSNAVRRREASIVLVRLSRPAL